MKVRIQGVVSVIPSLEWVSGPAGPLLRPLAVPAPVERSYDPLRDETALFMAFADLEVKQARATTETHDFILPEPGGPQVGMIRPKRTAAARAKLESQEEADETAFLARVIAFARKYGSIGETVDKWLDATHEMRDRVDAWLAGEEPDRFLPRGIKASTHVIEVRSGPALVIVTDDLLALIEWQASMAFLENWTIRNCDHCGKRYAVMPPTTRKTRIYCSEACSSGAYRARRKQREAGHATTKKSAKRKRGG